MNRSNKNCVCYPCHSKLEDCAFCYCPFYPCLDKGLGFYIRDEKKKLKVWSCQGCDWIHRTKIVDKIYRYIKAGQDVLR